MANLKGLVDSGATDCFMSPMFIKQMKLGMQPLQKLRKIWNIDNTKNKAGLIMHYVDLKVQTKNIHRIIQFLITNIRNEDLVLEYPWLSTFKPQFNWTNGFIHKKVLPIIIQSVNPQIPGKEPIIVQLNTQEKHCITRVTTSTKLAIVAQQYTKKAEIPPEYQQFMKVFSEEESKRYPPKRAWDHAIKFKPGAPDTVDCKVYLLN